MDCMLVSLIVLLGVVVAVTPFPISSRPPLDLLKYTAVKTCPPHDLQCQEAVFDLFLQDLEISAKLDNILQSRLIDTNFQVPNKRSFEIEKRNFNRRRKADDMCGNRNGMQMLMASWCRYVGMLGSIQGNPGHHMALVEEEALRNQQ